MFFAFAIYPTLLPMRCSNSLVKAELLYDQRVPEVIEKAKGGMTKTTSKTVEATNIYTGGKVLINHLRKPANIVK